MNLRTFIASAVAGVVVASAALLAPASASDATFTIAGGGLAVSDPTSTVDLGTVAPGTLLVAKNLGAITVTDTRSAPVAVWTARVTSTEFVNITTGGTSVSEKVALTNIAYASGVGTNGTGTVGAFTPSVVASMALPDLTRIAGTFAGIGSNSVTWDPTLTFTLLPNQLAGTYKGTITHSVA